MNNLFFYENSKISQDFYLGHQIDPGTLNIVFYGFVLCRKTYFHSFSSFGFPWVPWRGTKGTQSPWSLGEPWGSQGRRAQGFPEPLEPGGPLGTWGPWGGGDYIDFNMGL